MKRICAVVAVLLMAATGLSAQIFCWNLENYFDAYDDPATADEEFTPRGEHHWTRRKWEAKRNLIAKTIIASAERFGGDLPAIVGLCEVENSGVLRSLLEDTPLARMRYRSVHRESPDPRGIDVALAYDPSRVKLLCEEFITIGEFATREILYAKVALRYTDCTVREKPNDNYVLLHTDSVIREVPNDSMTMAAEARTPSPDIHGLQGGRSDVCQNPVAATCAAKSSHGLHKHTSQVCSGLVAATRENRFVTQQVDTFHIFVNHWPSKYSGAAVSEQKRQAVAEALLHKLDSIQAVDPQAAIILMGDFNDTPDSPSVKTLCEKACLVNLSPNEGGTIKFKGKWETIDLLLSSPAAAAKIAPAEVFSPDFLLEEDKAFLGVKPRRTNVGPRYNGGASDHLPIIARYSH